MTQEITTEEEYDNACIELSRMEDLNTGLPTEEELKLEESIIAYISKQERS